MPADRRGWVTQQVVKLATGMISGSPASLLIDADTVLLREQNWLAPGGVQLLCFSRDYHVPYEQHAVRMWVDLARPTGMTYITHHQLLQRELLQQMFPEGQDSLARWVRCADWTATRRALADSHSYGVWVSRNASDRVRYGKFLNEGVHPDRGFHQRASASATGLPNSASASLGQCR